MDLLPDHHRALGVATFNACWALLEQPASSQRNAELLRTAFTSDYHWSFVATPKESVIGEWMISRAAGEAGYVELALAYATRAWERTQTFDAPDWMVASAAEGMARAWRLAGDRDAFHAWHTHAQSLVRAISDDEERALIASQLAELDEEKSSPSGTEA
jgi:hypothetical protein